MSDLEQILPKKKLDLDDSACHKSSLKGLAADLLCDKESNQSLKEWKAKILAAEKEKGMIIFEPRPDVPHFKKNEP